MPDGSVTNFIQANNILKMDAASSTECEKTLKRLSDIQISKTTGRILEWAEDDTTNYNMHKYHIMNGLSIDAMIDGCRNITVKNNLTQGNTEGLSRACRFYFRSGSGFTCYRYQSSRQFGVQHQPCAG